MWGFRKLAAGIDQVLQPSALIYFAGGAGEIAPGAPSLIHSVTPAELESRRSGQTRCASCRSERERSLLRDIRRRHAHGRISARQPQFGRGDGSDTRNYRRGQPADLFEMSCWTYRQTSEKICCCRRPGASAPVTTCTNVRDYAGANWVRTRGQMMKETQGCVNQATGHQPAGNKRCAMRAASLPDLNLETVVPSSQPPPRSPSARLDGGF
jgi:hypothetical protein